ncbi:hypothetical protein BDV25DRAFT_132635 [Aspergillus avenaceus]|uniref:Zn(2)-C6 fungal-type domain-containing protein n=1 Tax=Aspergillus avenaceus TaxID=36643 RepID=A0A5N6TKD1_ASPAV|nr:hypothetical protein BDV25DRAFT_132635 [Aspergillus avenaceus]
MLQVKAKPPRRRRAVTIRSRTGCRTCRARHIKCDETPGSCTNCSSTGRVCDGYDGARLPRTAKGHVAFQISINLPAMTSDERRCFTFFTQHTMPMIVGCFDSDVWQLIMLQMSQAEPAVCHAVAALSALHEGWEKTGMVRLPAVSSQTAHRRFAFEQYGRAISTLRSRLSSKDPQVRLIALLCCLLFVFFELLEENYTNALTHLANGMHILMNQKGRAARSLMLAQLHQARNKTPSAEMALVKTFAHLDVQSAHFDPSAPVILLYPVDDQLIDVQYPSLEFHSIADAKDTLDPILNNIFRFWTTVDTTLRDPSADHQPLYQKHHEINTSLQDHITAFQNFTSTYIPLSVKESRSLDIIRLHHVILTINMETILSLSESVYDHFRPMWQECVDLGEEIVRSVHAEYGRKLPTLVMDLGINPPLCWVCLKCRDPRLRERALGLLQAWPHMEGPNSSLGMANMARATIAVETESADPLTGLIPEGGRMRNVFIEIPKDRGYAVLIYTLSDPTKIKPELHWRRFILDDDMIRY